MTPYASRLDGVRRLQANGVELFPFELPRPDGVLIGRLGLEV